MTPDLSEQIAAVKAQALATGRDVIDLASDDLGLVPSQPLCDYFCRLIRDPSATGDAASARAELRQSFAHWFEGRFGVALDPESEITELTSGKAGLAYTLWATINPGDRVLMPALAEPWVKASVLLVGGGPCELPSRAKNDWLPDLAAVPGDVVQNTRLLYFNSPHNPTGTVATQTFFQDVVNFARETGVLVLNNASHMSLGYDGYRVPSILEAEGANDVALEIHALPAMFNSLGVQVALIAGCADAIRALGTVKAAIDAPLSTAVARTAAWALNNAATDEALPILTRRRDALVDGLNALGWDVQKPHAGPFVWLPVPSEENSASFAQRLLEQTDILTLPGLAFGPTGDGHVRLSLGASEERIGEAVRRISHIA